MQNNTLNKNAESSQKIDNVSIILNNNSYLLLNINLQKEPQSSVNTRSRRIIKKVKEDESFISDINEIISGQEKKSKNSKKNQNNSSNSQNNKSSSNINKDFLDEDEMNEMIPNDNNEIVMEGNLFYRYGMDQIELDGLWSLSSEVAKCHFSYLLSCKQKVIKIHIDPKDLGISENNNSGGNNNTQVQGNNINNQNVDTNHNNVNSINNINGNEIKDMNNNNNIYNILINNKIIIIFIIF